MCLPCNQLLLSKKLLWFAGESVNIMTLQWLQLLICLQSPHKFLKISFLDCTLRWLPTVCKHVQVMLSYLTFCYCIYLVVNYRTWAMFMCIWFHIYIFPVFPESCAYILLVTHLVPSLCISVVFYFYRAYIKSCTNLFIALEIIAIMHLQLEIPGSLIHTYWLVAQGKVSLTSHLLPNTHCET